MNRIAVAIARRPLTVVVVIVIIGVFVVSLIPAAHGTLLAPIAGLDPRALEEHRWWSLFTSLVLAGSGVQAIIAVAAAIVGIGWAETLIGWRRTLLALLVTGVVASILGVGLESLGVIFHEYWSSSVRGVVALDPVTPIAGAVSWATAAARPLWRRRIRVLLVTTASALLLYSGHPADLYLLVAVLLGWLGGRITTGPAAPTPISRHETRTLLALATVVFAVGPLLTLLSATRYGVLSPLGVAVSDLAPLPDSHAIGCVAGHVALGCARELTKAPLHGIGGTIVGLLPLVLMLIGARGIVAGRRLAIWLLAVFAVVEGLVAAFYFGLFPLFGGRWYLPFLPERYWELSLWLVVSTLVPIVFGVVLIVYRRVTPVLPSRGRVTTFAIMIVAAVLVPGLVYVLGGLAFAGQFAPHATLGSLLDAFPDRLVPLSFLRNERPDIVPVGPVAHLLTRFTGPLFWIIVVAAAIVALRGRRGLPVEADEPERIRGLLRQGSGSLGWMATWAGNRLWVSEDGQGGVAYRLVDRVAVTVSDPIGDPPDPDAVLSGFISYCDQNAWTPAFYSVHDDWRARLEARGWSSLPVAEEALLDPATFSVAGKRMQDIRTSVNRAGRTGIVALWTRWRDLPIRVAAQIDAISEEWMAEKELPEMGFTLGGVDEARDDDVLLGVALDPTHGVLATTSWLPVWRDGVLVGRTLDLMRRSPGSPNGVMEFLIADAMERFREEGLAYASLSGSPLARSSGDAAEVPGPLGAVLELVARRLEPLYGFRSLLRFKSKFGSRLLPMSLCYADPLDLPRIALAVARAYLPGLTVAQARSALRSAS